MWTLYDWLNKFYSFCMATVVGIIARHGLTIEVYYRNQPKNLALYKPLPLQSFKTAVHKQQDGALSYKGGCGMHGHVHIKVSKKELAWATDKRLWVTSNIMFLKQLYH